MIRTQDRRSAVAGVLYAEDFDDARSPQGQPVRSASAPPPEPQPVIPTFSLDELRAAADQARQEGREFERNLSLHSAAARHNVLLAALSEQIAASEQKSVQIVEEGLDAMARTAFSMIAAALPAMCGIHAEHELRSVLRRILPPIRQVPEIQLRVHPSVRPALEAEIGNLLKGAATRVVWDEAASPEPGDIVITWQAGGAIRNTSATCREIRDALVGVFERHGRVTPPELQTELSHGE